MWAFLDRGTGVYTPNDFIFSQSPFLNGPLNSYKFLRKRLQKAVVIVPEVFSQRAFSAGPLSQRSASDGETSPFF